MLFAELYELSPDIPARPVNEVTMVYSRIDRGSHFREGRPGLSLTYVAEGKEPYTIGGRSIVVNSDQFLVMPSNAPVAYEHDAASGTATALCVFVPDQFEGNEMGCLEKPLLLSARAFGLGELFRKATKEIARGENDSARLAEAFGARILAGLSDFHEEVGQNLDALECVKWSTREYRYRQLERARAYLHEDLSRSIPISELASAAGISRFHLARLFREVFGISPGEYHRRLRLEKARHLIQREDLPCGFAGRRAGFANAAAFTRAYKRMFGHLPSSNS